EYMRELIAELYTFDIKKGDLMWLEMLTNMIWAHLFNNNLIIADQIRPVSEAASRFSLEKVESLKNTGNKISEAEEKYHLERLAQYYILKKAILKGKTLVEFQTLIQPTQIFK